MGHGWKLTAADLIITIYSELHSLIIGKKYSATDLAYYNKGNQFPSLIITNIDTAIGKVVFTAMSTVNDNPARLKAVSRRGMKITTSIN